MTQDEIIEITKQANFTQHSQNFFDCTRKQIEVFAKLVVAKEREALCEAMKNKEAWNFYDPADTAIKIIRARGDQE